jgi:hypothetical protein
MREMSIPDVLYSRLARYNDACAGRAEAREDVHVDVSDAHAESDTFCACHHAHAHSDEDCPSRDTDPGAHGGAGPRDDRNPPLGTGLVYNWSMGNPDCGLGASMRIDGAEPVHGVDSEKVNRWGADVLERWAEKSMVCYMERMK